MSRSYVSALLSDPSGDDDRRRKASYQGVCEGCGGPTTGSEGPAATPRFCASCAPNAYRKWTRERIIEAIQEWARRFGEAPTASEWGVRGGVHKCRIAEDGYEFPWAGSVYDTCGGRVKPLFESWATAIEEAGFPRPTTSRNYNHEPWRVEHMSPSPTITRDYLVFAIKDDEHYELLGECAARSSSDAVVAVAPGPGRFAAVAKHSLVSYRVASQLVANPSKNGAPE